MEMGWVEEEVEFEEGRRATTEDGTALVEIRRGFMGLCFGGVQRYRESKRK